MTPAVTAALRAFNSVPDSDSALTAATSPKALTSPLDNQRIKAGPLIITLFGDAIVPHGGMIWLGSLIALMSLFGFSERSVRTAVYRLVRENWLSASPSGRRSYYRLTATGQRQLLSASERIYGARPQTWNGQWLLLLISPPPNLHPGQRDALRRELHWLGFGTPSPWLWIRPDNRSQDDYMATLTEFQLSGQTIIMNASSRQLPQTGGDIAQLVGNCWPLAALASSYEKFLGQFSTRLSQLDKTSPSGCFMTRIMLIHAYRRLLLRDPQLPEELLPPSWPGHTARALCQQLYHELREPAEQYFMAVAETETGQLPTAQSDFFNRFKIP